MGALGGLYRPAPQGYNGNLAGCRTQPSVSMLAGFSAGCWGPPPGGPRRLVWYGADRPPRRSRVLSAADHCSRDANDAGLAGGAWLQSRRLAGDHCSHTVPYLVNGTQTLRKGPAACWGPTSLGSDGWGSSRLPCSR